MILPELSDLSGSGLPADLGAGDLQRIDVLLLEKLVDAASFTLEGFEFVAFQHPPNRQADPHRVDLAVVDHQLVVKMGSGRQACAADIADHLTLAHLHARLDAFADPALVVVGCFVAVGVTDDRLFAVAAGPAGFFDDAVAGRKDRRSRAALPNDAGTHLE